jgi:hypothetical protein
MQRVDRTCVSYEAAIRLAGDRNPQTRHPADRRQPSRSEGNAHHSSYFAHYADSRPPREASVVLAQKIV